MEQQSLEEVKEYYKEFILETERMSKNIGIKANIYKFMNNIINLLIIVCGCVIGSINIFRTKNVATISAIMGFGISMIKALQDMFKFSSKSVLLKSSSLKLKKLARTAENNKIVTELADINELIESLTDLYRQRDSIEMEVFKALIVSNDTPLGMKKSPLYSPRRRFQFDDVEMNVYGREHHMANGDIIFIPIPSTEGRAVTPIHQRSVTPIIVERRAATPDS